MDIELMTGQEMIRFYINFDELYKNLLCQKEQLEKELQDYSDVIKACIPSGQPHGNETKDPTYDFIVKRMNEGELERYKLQKKMNIAIIFKDEYVVCQRVNMLVAEKKTLEILEAAFRDNLDEEKLWTKSNYSQGHFNKIKRRTMNKLERHIKSKLPPTKH